MTLCFYLAFEGKPTCIYAKLLRFWHEVTPFSWNDQTLVPSQVAEDFLQFGEAKVEALFRTGCKRLLGWWKRPRLWKWWLTTC